MSARPRAARRSTAPIAAAAALAAPRVLGALPVQLGLFQRPDRWLHRWAVASRRGRARYVVAQTAVGTWGCSCPGWIYHRAICVHIRAVQASPWPARLAADG